MIYLITTGDDENQRASYNLSEVSIYGIMAHKLISTYHMECSVEHKLEL